MQGIRYKDDSDRELSDRLFRSGNRADFHRKPVEADFCIGEQGRAVSYKYQCPFCKANLDPGEKCDCRDGIEQFIRDCSAATDTDETGQIYMILGEINGTRYERNK